MHALARLRGVVLACAGLLAATTGHANAAPCDASVVGDVSVSGRGVEPVYRESGAGFFVSHMHVNADGAPDAYRPDGKGLSYSCDGVVAYENGHCVWVGQSQWQSRCLAAYRTWRDSGYSGERVCAFGFQVLGGRKVGSTTVGGVPTIQGPNDPMPGNFVSETSMNIPGHPLDLQRRYVNSREIPFVVLSKKVRRMIGASLGDVAVVHRPKTGKTAFAVFADYGPSWGLGEGSIALHEALGNRPIYRRHGTDRAKRNVPDDVFYLVFPNSKVRPTADHSAFRQRIETAASARFEAWGGAARLDACLRAARR